MLKPKMEEALNKQINEEMYSSYLYLSMSAYFESVSLTGFASWMKIQSAEEYAHAMKIYTYIIQKGGRAKLSAIAEPKQSWDTPLNVFEDTLKHEQHITACIDELVNLALELKDHATNNFLQWFVTEQVEEEANATKIIDDLKMIGNNNHGIFLLDRELGQRATPAAEATAD